MLKGCGKTFLHKSVLSDEQVDFLYRLKIEKLCSKMDFVQSTKSWLRLFSHLWGNCSFLFLFFWIDRIGCELYVEWSVWENTKLWQREKDIWEGKRGLRSGKRKRKKIFFLKKGSEIDVWPNGERWLGTNRVGEGVWRSCTTGPQKTLLPSILLFIPLCSFPRSFILPSIKALIGSEIWTQPKTQRLALRESNPK